MDRLPPELLLTIFSFLDNPAPSELRLEHQPSISMLSQHGGGGLDYENDSKCPLKRISVVCSQWRKLILGSLFRHVLWTTHGPDPETSSPSKAPIQQRLNSIIPSPTPLLQFLETCHLQTHVQSFTMVVDYRDHEAESLGSNPRICPIDLKLLWRQIFSVVDPSRFTLLAHHTILASLLYRTLDLNDAWIFDMPCHILSLSTEKEEDKEEDANVHHPSPSSFTSSSPSSPSSSSSPCLMTIRPWTSFHLNEGSFMKAYATYEWYQRHPPSILSTRTSISVGGGGEGEGEEQSATTDEEEDMSLTAAVAAGGTLVLPPTIRTLRYVAIFPMLQHISAVFLRPGGLLPRRIYVRLTPIPLPEQHGRLMDAQKDLRADPGDLWMERDQVYTYLLGWMGVSSSTTGGEEEEGWVDVTRFESGDTSDGELWVSIKRMLDAGRMGMSVIPGGGGGAGAGGQPPLLPAHGLELVRDGLIVKRRGGGGEAEEDVW